MEKFISTTFILSNSNLDRVLCIYIGLKGLNPKYLTSNIMKILNDFKSIIKQMLFRINIYVQRASLILCSIWSLQGVAGMNIKLVCTNNLRTLKNIFLIVKQKYLEKLRNRYR